MSPEEVIDVWVESMGYDGMGIEAADLLRRFATAGWGVVKTDTSREEEDVAFTTRGDKTVE